MYQLPLYNGGLSVIETAGIAGDLVLGDAGGQLGVIGKNDASLSLYDTADLSLKKTHALPSPPSDSMHHQWSQKTVMAMEDDRSLWLLDRSGEVRRLDLDGGAPALIAIAGSAICHA